MSTTVDCNCIHREIVNGAAVPTPHRFLSHPRARAGRNLLLVEAEAVLVEGDTFENEAAPDHIQPKAGAFATPPHGRGCFNKAAQDLLIVDDKSVVTRDSSITTCCEASEQMSCRAATASSTEPLLLIHTSKVLTGL